MTSLPKGIFYKVLSEGNQASPKPTVRSIITEHYTGKCLGDRTETWNPGLVRTAYKAFMADEELIMTAMRNYEMLMVSR